MTTVGVVANPASGRDIRRLVTGASVFGNAEKGSMVHRLMAGLGATGVEHVLVMPAGDGVSGSLRRHVGAGHRGDGQRFPTLEFLKMPLRGTAADTTEAVDRMVRAGVSAIVVLGGDGTHRVVAKGCGSVPICALSTGTNNAFPEMREATVAGIATGLVATGQVAGPGMLRRGKQWRVCVDGPSAPRRVTDCALVDVALATGRWVGARALWRARDIVESAVSFTRPDSIGLSAVAAMAHPVARDAPHGLHLRLADLAEAKLVVHAALAPGLVVPVGVHETRLVEPGDVIEMAGRAGSLALEGEREIELGPHDRAEVRLETSDMATIDIDAVMTKAARRGLMAGRGPLAAVVCAGSRDLDTAGIQHTTDTEERAQVGIEHGERRVG